jgi:hypothetical protein
MRLAYILKIAMGVAGLAFVARSQCSCATTVKTGARTFFSFERSYSLPQISALALAARV